MKPLNLPNEFPGDARDTGTLLPISLLILAGSLTVTIAYYALTLGDHSHVDDSYVLRSSAALLRYAIYFVAGYYLPRLLDSRNFVRAFSVLYFLVVIHIFINIDPSIPSMDFRYLSERPQQLRNYQFYADTFALFSIIIIATRASRAIRTAIVLTATACLFLLISRAAFYTYLMVAALILFDDYRGSWRRYVFPVAYLFVCYWTLISPGAFQTESPIATTFAGDLANSASTLSRLLILQRGLQHLLTEAWLFGDFRAHYKIFMQPGTYIHNYLSLWADYGILPFRCVRRVARWIRALSSSSPQVRRGGSVSQTRRRRLQVQPRLQRHSPGGRPIAFRSLRIHELRHALCPPGSHCPRTLEDPSATISGDFPRSVFPAATRSGRCPP